MAFVEAVQSLDELALVPRRIHGPCVLNVVPGGKTPSVDLREAQAMGYKLAILPATILNATVEGADAALLAIKTTHTAPALKVSVATMFRRFGADEWEAVRLRSSKRQSGTSARDDSGGD